MKSFLHNTWKHRAHVVMALPAFLILFFIMYVPMAGLVMAFKNFDYTLGIWKLSLIHILPGSKGLSPHELAHKWVKDLRTHPDMSIEVG